MGVLVTGIWVGTLVAGICVGTLVAIGAEDLQAESSEVLTINKMPSVVRARLILTLNCWCSVELAIRRRIVEVVESFLSMGIPLFIV